MVAFHDVLLESTAGRFAIVSSVAASHPTATAAAYAAAKAAGEAWTLAMADSFATVRPDRTDGPAAVILLVGPEGGLARAEVAQAEARGFVAVGLGPRILRVETAAIVAVALAQAAGGGLGR